MLFIAKVATDAKAPSTAMKYFARDRNKILLPRQNNISFTKVMQASTYLNMESRRMIQGLNAECFLLNAECFLLNAECFLLNAS